MPFEWSDLVESEVMDALGVSLIKCLVKTTIILKKWNWVNLGTLRYFESQVGNGIRTRMTS